jgi:hypothetical protein
MPTSRDSPAKKICRALGSQTVRMRMFNVWTRCSPSREGRMQKLIIFYMRSDRQSKQKCSHIQHEPEQLSTQLNQFISTYSLMQHTSYNPTKSGVFDPTYGLTIKSTRIHAWAVRHPVVQTQTWRPVS